MRCGDASGRGLIRRHALRTAYSQPIDGRVSGMREIGTVSAWRAEKKAGGLSRRQNPAGACFSIKPKF